MTIITRVTKRDGTTVPFDERKIENAILKAFFAVYPQTSLTKSEVQATELKAKALTSKVVRALEDGMETSPAPGIEDIQDIVEDEILSVDRKVYKAYSLYRAERAQKRAEQIIEENNQKMFADYIGENDWQTKENAAMAYSLQGLNNYLGGQSTENYWLSKIYPRNISDAHRSGDIHLHDLSLYAPYCCGWSLEDLLKVGFKGVPGKAESGPAKHFGVAMGQMVNFLYTLQGEAAGAQAFSNVDTLLAPFIRADNLSYKEVKQVMQNHVFNMNVSTRVGFQTPFTNYTMDLQCPENYKDKPVIIGGKMQDSVYGDYQAEMDMINKAFAECMLEGDYMGRQFSFPIPTYNLTKGFNWDSEVFDKVIQMTAKYGIPSFCNYINSNLSPQDATSMCCRLRLDRRELWKRGGGQFGSAPLTGSIGVVTINLARIGYLSKTKEEFFTRLKAIMDLARDSLNIKRKAIEKETKRGLYPYSRFYLRDTYERHGAYWANHFSTIGINGMNECLMNFFGAECSTASAKGVAFTNEVLDFMRDVISAYQADDDKVMFNLEATPAEGTGYRLALKDKKLYPDILTSGHDEPYYTNSTQLPVNFTDDIFEALDLQESIQTKYTGGTTFHTYLGERIPDDVCKKLVRKIAESYKIPYFTISPTFSICPEHGYIEGEHFTCPICGAESEVWARVVGFNRPVKQWNKGKTEEFKDRKTFHVGVKTSAA